MCDTLVRRVNPPLEMRSWIRGRRSLHSYPAFLFNKNNFTIRNYQFDWKYFLMINYLCKSGWVKSEIKKAGSVKHGVR